MNYMSQIKAEIFNITNEVRNGFGLNLLEYSNELDRMAQIHTNEMYSNSFFQHENPYCNKVKTLYDRTKYCKLTNKFSKFGENLANYPAEEVTVLINPITRLISGYNKRTMLRPKTLCRNIIKGWYNSLGHRENLLCIDYDTVGFGLLLYPRIIKGIKIEYILVTQNFGKRSEKWGKW